MDERDLSLDKLAIILESIFAVLFCIPSIYVIIKYRKYLDRFSKTMLIIYQVELIGKLAFFVCDYLLDLQGDLRTFVKERAFSKASLFCINSLFLMSLHIFV